MTADVELTGDDIRLTITIPRAAFTIHGRLPPPATVTQDTVELQFGIPKRVYMKLVREGQITAKKIGRYYLAAYEDVRRAVTQAPTSPPEGPSSGRAPMSFDAAVAYLAGASSPRETRGRAAEIRAQAVGDNAVDLLMAAAGARRGPNWRDP